MESEKHADPLQSLIELDETLTGVHQELKENHKWTGWMLQLSLIPLSAAVYYFGFTLAALVLLIVGLPFSDEWYRLYKDLKKIRALNGHKLAS